MAFLKIFSTEWITQLRLLLPEIAYIHAQGNAGQTMTSAVTDIPFIEQVDTHSCYDGTKITMPFTGIVDISASIANSGGGNWSVIAYIDGIAIARIFSGYVNTDTVKSGCFKRRLNAGQTLSLRTQNHNGALTNDTVYHYFTATITEV